MEKEISQTLANNVKKLIAASDKIKNAKGLSDMVGCNHATIYGIINATGNSKLHTIDDVALALKVPVWTLFLKDFPYESSPTKPIKEISKQGYTLLQAFENAPTEAKIAILDQAEFLIRKYDKASPEANRVAETRSGYNQES